MAFAARLVHRIDAHDRLLLLRWALGEDSGRTSRRVWIAITHLGGAGMTIGSVVLPWGLHLVASAVSLRTMLSLAISHGVVQIVKRFVNRARPDRQALIALPDHFSFPSGHATASLAIALSYAVAFPAFAMPLAALGLTVGFSRVVLGVHYPGDVLVGQGIAALTVLGIQLVG
jgi:undecaprenyl-diphosphatase